MAIDTPLRSIRETCERLSIGPAVLRHLRATEQIGHVRVGGRIKFSDAQIADYIARNTHPRPVVLTVLPGGKAEVA